MEIQVTILEAIKECMEVCIIYIMKPILDPFFFSLSKKGSKAMRYQFSYLKFLALY